MNGISQSITRSNQIFVLLLLLMVRNHDNIGRVRKLLTVVSYKTHENWSRDILSGSRQKLILSTLFHCY